MSENIEVISVNISEKKGTTKHPVDRLVLTSEGAQGDAHAGPWHRQVSLLSQESIERFGAKVGRKFAPGEFAENITLQGVDLAKVRPGDRFFIGPAELEVTQLGKRCHGDGCAIFREVGVCVMPKEGVFCRVVQAGTVRAGLPVSYQPRIFRFRIVTLSDRAFQGVYPDQSGPLIHKQLKEFLDTLPWSSAIDTVLLPDDETRLKDTLQQTIAEGVDVVFTTGGTGAGPRDITPEVVLSLADKAIPGIMEAIRAKYGAQNPRALLSRGVTVLAGRTLIYTLPGSTKAVAEYMGEIVITLEHLIQMVNQVDSH